MSLINNSTSPEFFAWRPAAWLHVEGEDAPSFLQGQCTQDLRELTPGRAAYGLWLSVKGKVLADSFVIAGTGKNEFWLGSYFSPAAVIRERLEAYVIADDVTLDDQTSAWTGITVFGGAERERSSGGGCVFAGRRGAATSREYVFPVQEEKLAVALTVGRELDALEMERRRIMAGIPAIPLDLGPTDLPNEGGLEGEAISYTKGCYLGQEVMARLKSMGQVRRRLLRVKSAGDKIPRLPAPLFVGARQVGELRSAASDPAGGFIGLAMLTLMHLSPAGLSLAPEATPTLSLIDQP